MTFKDFVTSVIGVMNSIAIPLIFAFTFCVFVYGVFKYFILNGGSDESRQEGRQFVIWGILGLVMLFSVWGVVNILLSTLGLTRS